MQTTKIQAVNRNLLKFLKYNTNYSTNTLSKCTLSLNSRFKWTIPKPNLKHQLLNRNKFFSNSTKTESFELIDQLTYEKVCEETLESLTDYVEQLIEDCDNFVSADVSYSSGVLTVNLGGKYGTYVINRQSPNRQIWLSSPTSGPKRYDFIGDTWIYKHDGVSLHRLLQDELSKIVKNVDFSRCSYAKI